MSAALPTLPQPTAQPSPPLTPARLTRRVFLAASIALPAGLTLYANSVGRHELDITYPTFRIRNLPAAFNGFRIVQISDLHLEEYTEDFFLRQVIHEVNALNPDLLLITGDFASRGPLSFQVSLRAVVRCAELLATLTCPLRFAVLGNHDAIIDLSAGSSYVRTNLERHGIPVLVNQSVRIERHGAHIILAGLDDISFGHPDLALAVPPSPDAPVLLMAHEPDYANDIAAHPRGRFVDLILSGHTHGGQIRLPGIRPLALPPLGKLFPHGHYTVGSSQLYVNRGIGTVGIPFRFDCPPEITVATLRPA